MKSGKSKYIGVLVMTNNSYFDLEFDKNNLEEANKEACKFLDLCNNVLYKYKEFTREIDEYLERLLLDKSKTKQFWYTMNIIREYNTPKIYTIKNTVNESEMSSYDLGSRNTVGGVISIHIGKRELFEQ